MTPTNYFRGPEFALKWFKRENPDYPRPEHEVNRLIIEGIIKIGKQPIERYADNSGRYFIVGANGL